MNCTNPQQQAIPLTQGEYGLLLALAQNARRVLNREQAAGADS